MNKQAEIAIRKEINNILNSHLDKPTRTIKGTDLSDLLDDIMGEVRKLDYISKEQFEEYRDNWNKKMQEQDSCYNEEIHLKNNEIEACYKKIDELKKTISTDGVKQLLETKLAIANSHKRLLKEFVKDILEEM